MTSLPADIPAYSSSAPIRAEVNINAIVSLVTGIVTWLIGWLGSCSLAALMVVHPLFNVVSWCPSLIGLLSTVTGLVTGHMALNQINTHPGQHTGRSMALTGLVLNYLGLALAIGTLCLMTLGLAGFITYALTLPDGPVATPRP